jgi:hypothetical protein
LTDIEISAGYWQMILDFKNILYRRHFIFTTNDKKLIIEALEKPLYNFVVREPIHLSEATAAIAADESIMASDRGGFFLMQIPFYLTHLVENHIKCRNQSASSVKLPGQSTYIQST